MIRTLEHDYPMPLADFLLADPTNGRPRPGIAALPTATASTGIPAYVNHGRWVVDCPFCPSAQMVSERDPRFYCVSCRNEGAGGKWLPIILPKNRAAIEAVLDERPEHATRNWRHPETVADLKRENAYRGL